jgi:Family of unknown function (DUF6262)
MRADNTGHLTAAARRRSQTTRQRAEAALRRLDAAGKPITFDALAREANVSRSWLYSQPDLRSQIQRLRDQQPPHLHRIPDRQRASDASLQRRLDIAAERVRQLEAVNQRLRQALAEALGDRRRDRDTPVRRRTSTVIGPC